MFGWGPLPRMGIAGGGVAYVCYNVVATVALIVYLRSKRTTLRLPFDLRLIEWRLMRDILQVGGLAALSAMIPAFTVLLITAAVARFGIDAVAGYGIAVRAEYLLLPLYYGICSGVLPMVGMNVGAGQIPRARSVAWTGAFVAAAIGGAAALLLVLAPHAWVGLFNKEPAVIAAGSLYFRIVAIQYPLTALGIVLAAAAQGAGHPLWPFAGGAARLITAGVGGWLVVTGLGGSIATLFAMLAIAGVFYCVIITAGQLSGRSIPDRA
jgi:Na+-driven multidrug efflux pump